MPPRLPALPEPQPYRVSFEFFPPSTPEMESSLWRAIKRLEPLGPEFVSVTYGAAGGTRERTHRTVKRILEETDLQPAAHLTCIGATREEVEDIAREYARSGVRHIVALRGDPTPAGAPYVPHPGGFAYASDLVAGLRGCGAFEITVAAYPEVHPEAASATADLENLKRKVDAGASRAITQFFFYNDLYYRFLDRAAAAGITVPIIPGIMPVTSFARMCRFAATCGASVPSAMGRLFEGLDSDAETRKLVAATVCAEQCLRLAEQGVRDFHFYTLNRADLSYAICHILGLRPRAPASAAHPAG
jgi:methylenetetrahydrofolate reductase (NADPH)